MPQSNLKDAVSSICEVIEKEKTMWEVEFHVYFWSKDFVKADILS